jgi:hypothetical protein
MWHKRRPVRVFRGRASYFTSKTVSRVLYLTVIYLGAPLPARSSHLLRTAGPAYLSSHGVAPDRVYSDGQFPAVGCALTAPFHPYHCGKTAVIRVERCPRPLIKGRSVAAGNDCNRERQISPASFHTIPRFPVPLRDYREHRHSLFLTSTVLPQWRYISVALFLKSPSAGVTRYPCPVEPGLSSWTAFRPAHATVCFTRPFILQERGRLVNG